MSDFSKHAAKARLAGLAQSAAAAYLEYDTPLNESITKIARDEGLSTEEVNRVCEMANLDVYQQMFKTAEDKTFVFDVAESRDIIDEINKTAGAAVKPPVGYVAIDVVHNEPESEKTASPNVSDEMKFFTYGDDASSTHKQRLSVIMDKLASIQDRLKQEKFEAEMKKEAAVQRFLHDAKQMVLQKKASFENIYHNLVDARPDHYRTSAKLLKMASLQMGRSLNLAAEHEKVAGAAVDPSLFREGLSFSGRPLKVLNGRQALVMSLDTLLRQDAELDYINRGLDLTGDKVNYLRKKLHNIVADEVQREGE